MRQLLNTLYVMTEGSYVHLDHETLKVEVDGTTKLQVPLHHLGGVVCFGNVMMSPFLIHRCADDGRAVVFLDRNGRFKARVEGPVSGNVLLRRAQHLAASDGVRCTAIARNIVAGRSKTLGRSSYEEGEKEMSSMIPLHCRSAQRSWPMY